MHSFRKLVLEFPELQIVKAFKKMRIILIFIFLSQLVMGQKKYKTDCNVVFICLDSLTYDAICQNTYLRDTIFVCKESSTSTNSDSYNGKYIIGKGANLEFFKPTSSTKLGDNLNDFGIEFKTRKVGNLKMVSNNAKLEIENTKLNVADTVLPWYDNVSFKNDKNTFALSILEYRTEYLEYLGFSKSEIENEMTYSYFNETLSDGRNYPRQFETIKSVTIQIHAEDLENLRKFAVLNGLKHKTNTFFNSEFSLTYNLVNAQTPTKVKKIEIKLAQNQANREIEISKSLKVSVYDKTCEFLFL